MFSQYKVCCPKFSVTVVIEDGNGKEGFVVAIDPPMPSFVGGHYSRLTKHMKELGSVSMYNLFTGLDKREVGTYERPV